MRKECLVTVGRFSVHLVEGPDPRPALQLEVDKEPLATFAVGRPKAVWDLSTKLCKSDLRDLIYVLDIIDNYVSQFQHSYELARDSDL